MWMLGDTKVLSPKGKVQASSSASRLLNSSLWAMSWLASSWLTGLGFSGSANSGIWPSAARPKYCVSAAAQVSGSSKRSEEHTSELQSRGHLVCRLLLEKKKQT